MSSEALTPTTYNLTLTSTNTEYSQALPAGCKHFSVQNRSAVDMRLAFVTGKVAASTAPYATIKSGGAYTSPEKMTAANVTLYLAATSAASPVAEIIAWSRPTL